MKTHKFKILPKYFTEIENGNKTFEVRKNDRDFKVGDLLVLQEHDGDRYTGKQIEKTISYVLANSECVIDSYYVLSFKEPNFNDFITVDFAHKFVKYLKNNGWEIKKQDDERIFMTGEFFNIDLPITDAFTDFRRIILRHLDAVADDVKDIRIFELIEEIIRIEV